MADQLREEKLKRTIELFRHTDRLHRRIFENAAVSNFGIHRSQHMMLMCISRHSAYSQKELAKKMGISPAAVAVTLKKLEADGLINRSAVTDDNRRNSIVITEKGQNIINETHRLFTNVDRTMFSGFSDEEIEIFTSCLEKMHGNLGKAATDKEGNVSN